MFLQIIILMLFVLEYSTSMTNRHTEPRDSLLVLKAARSGSTWLYWLLQQIRSGDKHTLGQQLFVEYEVHGCALVVPQLRSYLQEYFGNERELYGSLDACLNHTESRHCCSIAKLDKTEWKNYAGVAATIHPFHTPPEPLSSEDWQSVLQSNPHMHIAVLIRSNLVKYWLLLCVSSILKSKNNFVVVVFLYFVENLF